MSETKTTSRTVRIVRVPDGKAPQWIRQAWIGVELPVSRRATRVLPDQGRTEVHAVRVVDAVEALRLKGRHSAAIWWNDQALARPVGARLLYFDGDDCQAPPVDSGLFPER